MKKLSANKKIISLALCLVLVVWVVNKNCEAFDILFYSGTFLFLLPSVILIIVFWWIEKGTFYGGIAGMYASILGGNYLHFECGSMDGVVVIIYATSYVAASCALLLVSIYTLRAFDK